LTASRRWERVLPGTPLWSIERKDARGFSLRSVAVELHDGGLAVVSPIRTLETDAVAQLAELGPVRFLVAPNHYHHLGLAAWRERFPDARVVCAPAAHPRLVRLQWDDGYPATRTPMELPVSMAVRRVVSEAVGGEVLVQPTSGASLGQNIFTEVLKVPIFSVPIVNHDNNQHAKDENLRLQNLWDGIEVLGSIMARLGAAWPGVVP